VIALGWLYWIVYQLVSIALMPVGIVLCGIASLCHDWTQRPSRYPYADGRVRWQWSFFLLWLWCNEEDGIEPGTLVPSPWTAFKWSALRNSANNMRALPGAFFVCDSSKLTFRDYSWGYIATQGWRQCIKYRRLRIGWLIPRTASTGSPAWPVASIP
jgi:hypothetical protein